MPYCPFCGSEVSEQDSFCRSCGAMLNGGIYPKPAPKGPDGTKVLAVILVVFVLFAAAGGAIIVALLNGGGSNTPTEDITRTYKWEYEGVKFNYTLTVEKSYYDRMKSSPIDRSGTVSTDRYVKEGGGTVFGGGDYVVVDDKLISVVDDLQGMYKAKIGNFATNDDYVKFVTAFVQICIVYDRDEAGSTEYWRYPMETLCDGTGDCEDTSILLAALIDAKGLNGGFLLMPGHAMCAIDSSDLYYSYDNLNHSSVYNLDFYPIETTYDEFETIGSISPATEVLYLHMYMGHAVDYYFKS